MARDVCRGVVNVQMKKDCIFDLCATGLVSAAEGVVAAEVMETKVNTRGIPLLVGRGRCLDSIQRPYVAISTRLESASDCKNVLRSLSLTSGVMGAQLRRGGTCEVIVEPDANATAVKIKRGWGQTLNAEAKGHGLICGVTEETEWRCWQLA